MVGSCDIRSSSWVDRRTLHNTIKPRRWEAEIKHRQHEYPKGDGVVMFQHSHGPVDTGRIGESRSRSRSTHASEDKAGEEGGEAMHGCGGVVGTDAIDIEVVLEDDDDKLPCDEASYGWNSVWYDEKEERKMLGGKVLLTSQTRRSHLPVDLGGKSE